MAKSNFYKADSFLAGDSLAMLKQDLEDIDPSKEAQLVKKNLLRKHG